MAKTKQKTIWVIEEGEYSDYHVVGVYSTEENAKTVLEKMHGDAPQIREWNLDPDVEELRKGLSLWRVLMLKNGDIENCELSQYSGSHSQIYYMLRQRTNLPNILVGFTWAKTQKQAIKSTNEQRLKFIASGEWEKELTNG